jgi:Ca-activated chloride channel family protein
LEKTEVEEIRFSDAEEKYRIFVLIALGLIFVEFISRKLIFKSIV